MNQATKPSAMSSMVAELSKEVTHKRTDDVLYKKAGFKNADEALRRLKEVSDDKEKLERLIKEFLGLPDSVIYLQMVDRNSLLGGTKISRLYSNMRSAVNTDKPA